MLGLLENPKGVGSERHPSKRQNLGEGKQQRHVIEEREKNPIQTIITDKKCHIWLKELNHRSWHPCEGSELAPNKDTMWHRSHDCWDPNTSQEYIHVGHLENNQPP